MTLFKKMVASLSDVEKDNEKIKNSLLEISQYLNVSEKIPMKLSLNLDNSDAN
jgi:hypothetical protein